MPFSDTAYDKELELYFSLVSHPCVLDIVPGEGKYGRMLRRVRPAENSSASSWMPSTSSATGFATCTTKSGFRTPPS
jgi:hypothetical protein